MVANNGKKNGRSNGKAPKKKTARKRTKAKSNGYSERAKNGQFQKGCKPGPGGKVGSYRGIRKLLETLDQEILEAVEAGDLAKAKKLLYAEGPGAGLMALLKAHKEVGTLDVLLKGAEVADRLDVTIVIGDDRVITEPPPGVNAFPIEGRITGD